MFKSLLLLLFVLVALPVAADDYPNRDIEIIVPYSAGGGNDLFVRSLKPALERALGVTVIVRNLPGGGGAVGWSEFTTREPDGYTLAVVTDGVLNQIALGIVRFKADDFDFVANLLQEPYVLASNKALGYETVGALVEGTGERKLKVGVSGVGSSSYFAANRIAKALGVRYSLIPFDGGTETIAAAMGGHIDAVVLGGAELRSALKSNRISPLALSYAERSPKLPDIATFREQGIDWSGSVFRGIAAPAGLDPEREAVLRQALVEASRDPEFQKAVDNLGADIAVLSGSELDAFIDDLDRSINDQISSMLK